MVRTSWRCFKGGLLLVLLGGLAALLYLDGRVDEEIRQQVEKRLTEYYPDLQFRVHAAQLVQGQGIEIKGIEVLDPQVTGPGHEIAYIDEIVLGCDTSLQQMVQNGVVIERFVVRRPRIRATRLPDGRYNVEKLWPLPQRDPAQRPPPGAVENATLEVVDATQSPPRRFTLRDVNLTFGRPPAASSDGDQSVRFSGDLRGDHLSSLKFGGTYDPAAGDFQVGGTFDGLQLSPELHAALPAELSRHAQPLAGLRARAGAKFHVARSGRGPLQFDVAGGLSEGRIDDPRLPYPLADLSARFRVNNSGLKVSDLRARNRQTTVQISATLQGLRAGAPLTLEVHGRRVVLDRQMFDVLPEEARVLWHRFLPAGEIDMDGTLVYDGRTWQPDFDVTCLNVSFAYEKFPYRLERAAGTVSMHDNVLKFDLGAYARTRPLHVWGHVNFPGPNGGALIEISGKHLRLDEEVLAALKEKPQQVLRAMDPDGTFDFYGRFWHAPGESARHQYIRLAIAQGNLKYDKFPYPIGDVQGLVEMHDGVWTFQNLTGTNGSAWITCNGRLTPPDQGGLLSLSFVATGAPLDGELRAALKQRGERLWNDLRPHGSADIAAEVRYAVVPRQLGLWVRVRPRGDTASIEPRAFPYRLEKLRGTMTYQDGQVTLEGIRAEHGDVTVATDGSYTFNRDGGWKLQLDRLAVDRLSASRDLLAAVPEKLRQTLTKLQPTGTANLRGSVAFSKGPGPDDRARAEWDTTLYCHGNSLRAGVPITDIYGSVRLGGSYQADDLQARGELTLDSLVYQGHQFTQISGPMMVRRNQVWLGTPDAPQLDPARHRHMTARLYGGVVFADAWVTAEPQEYSVRAVLSGADLGQFARESLPGRQRLSGKVSGTLNLRGRGSDVQGLRGNGTVQLREADVYELPQMLSLLNILRLQPPGGTTLTSSDIRYRIQGDLVYLDKIDFNGELLSLLGTGEVGFDKHVLLTFRASVANNGFRLPLISDASEQFVGIHVSGTIDQPQIREEAFPAVKQVLQQIQEDLQTPVPLPLLPPTDGRRQRPSRFMPR